MGIIFTPLFFFIKLVNVISLKLCPLLHTDSDCIKAIDFLLAVDEKKRRVTNEKKINRVGFSGLVSYSFVLPDVRVLIVHCQKRSVIDVKKKTPNNTYLLRLDSITKR